MLIDLNTVEDNLEEIGNNCDIPTSGQGFVKNFIHLTGQGETEEFSTSIRTEQRRSNVITKARFQPFCKKHNNIIGCYEGFGVCPRFITERNIALFIYKKHFCLIWKSQGVSFKKVIEELKLNFKVVDNVMSDKLFKISCFKLNSKPKKVLTQLTDIIVYDIETFNTNRAVPYDNCFYKAMKVPGKYYRDISDQKLEKCQKGCIVFKGTVNINELLDHFLKFKGEAEKVNIENVKYNLNRLAHNGSGFDLNVVLNKLPELKTVVSLIKNGSGIVSAKMFHDYVDENGKIPQYVHFTCGKVHIYKSLKKISKSFILQQSLLKQEMNHDETYEDTWQDREREWLPYLKNDVLSTVFCNARYSKGMEEITGLSLKNS